MDLSKFAKGASDIRAIYLTITLFMTGIAWAGNTYFDTKYLTIADATLIPIQIKLDALSEAVEEMVLEKRFESDPAKLHKLDTYIEYKKEKMDALIKKYKLSQ